MDFLWDYSCFILPRIVIYMIGVRSDHPVTIVFPKMDLTFNTKTMWNFRPSKCLYTIFHSFIENLCRCLLKIVFTMNWNGQTSEAYMAFIFESIFFFWGKYSPQYMYYHKYFYRNRTIKGHSHNWLFHPWDYHIIKPKKGG